MIYVYCPRISDGARYLVRALGDQGQRIQMERGREYAKALHAVPPELEKKRDVLVVWGQRLVTNHTCRILNAKAPIGNKYKELQKLAKAGIPCPESSLYNQRGAWMGRSFHHQSGDDLIHGGYNDYFVRLVPDVKQEIRMHVFNGHVFRTGLKVHDPEDQEHHPLFRTWNTGWMVTYSRAKVLGAVETRKYWRVAVDAVKALDYDFGAVDIGIRESGKAVVFEVNSAPGLDGMTIQRYAEQIKAYAERA